MLDSILKLFRGTPAVETAEQRAHRLSLIARLTFEVIPLNSVHDAVAALPPGSPVSITASPTKGLSATQELAETLLGAGHHPIPHIAARLVRDRTHTTEIGRWLSATGITTIFLVGGDAEEPGDYFDAVSFLRDLLDTDHGLTTIGVTGYPDSHPLVTDEALHIALHDKQSLLAEAGLEGYCSTQMCFDDRRISSWLRRERAAGLLLPVHLGLAGVVDRTRLLTMGVRLGVGQSLRYLRKNRAAITKMMTTTSYDPNDLLVPLSPDLAELGVDGLHVFTFNQVAATARWRATMVP